MTLKIFENLRQDEEFLTRYTRGRDELILSGIEKHLLTLAQPKFLGIEGNLDALAVQAARSAGYHEALRDIFNFKEFYLFPKQVSGMAEKLSQQPKYGASERLIKQGDLTQEEINGHIESRK